MDWVWLLLAGLMEIGWVYGLKCSEGYTKFWPSVFTIATMVFSFYFLSLSLKTIPLGTAYAIWTGIGAVGAVLMGMLLFDEPRSVLRMICIGIILFGIVSLKLVTAGQNTVN